LNNIHVGGVSNLTLASSAVWEEGEWLSESERGQSQLRLVRQQPDNATCKGDAGTWQTRA